MSDNPQDQSSRWSGAFQGNTTDQWIVLRLESLSVLGEFRSINNFELHRFALFFTLVLEKITFGKVSVIECRGLHHLDAYVDSSPNVRTNANPSSKRNSDARYSSPLQYERDQGPSWYHGRSYVRSAPCRA